MEVEIRGWYASEKEPFHLSVGLQLSGQRIVLSLLLVTCVVWLVPPAEREGIVRASFDEELEWRAFFDKE